MQHEVLKLDTRDNVVIALADLHQGNRFGLQMRSILCGQMCGEAQVCRGRSSARGRRDHVRRGVGKAVKPSTRETSKHRQYSASGH